MNFAPYQDQSPDIERALSPPIDGSRSKSPNIRPARTSPVTQGYTSNGQNQSRPSIGQDRGMAQNVRATGFGSGDVEGGRLSLGAFETSLPIRVDYEAMLAYILLPPAGGVFLLLLEHKSDYVRMRAYRDVDTLEHFQVPFFGRLADSFVDDE
ncbi:hypothetical protein FQN57_000067 [Myotisia sp. PD_48]|nr:hypothetical protein FQN57_000067 [Myotisia sp. PD_48]